MAGKKEEAAAAIPDDLVDDVALCGPRNGLNNDWRCGKTALLPPSIL